MHDPVLEWLDQLDEHWCRTETPPQLSDWIDQLPRNEPQLRDEIVEELARADLSWRIRTAVKNAQRPTDADPLLASDFLKLPIVRNNPELVQRLVDDEYLHCCRADETTEIDRFVGRIGSEFPLEIESQRERLLNIALVEYRLQLLLFSPDSDALGPSVTHALGPSIEIGRATETEPTPPALLKGKRPRLIIAPCRDVSLSRQQVQIDRVQWSSVRVRNTSSKVPIVIDDSTTIKPKHQVTLPAPFVMLVGRFRLKIESIK